jgi:hypothetical protein
MDNTVNAISNFFNQNFYGFCILLMAAFFYYHKLDVAGATFFGAGAALMGVRQPQVQAPNTVVTTSTIHADPPPEVK